MMIGALTKSIPILFFLIGPGIYTILYSLRAETKSLEKGLLGSQMSGDELNFYVLFLSSNKCCVLPPAPRGRSFTGSERRNQAKTAVALCLHQKAAQHVQLQENAT